MRRALGVAVAVAALTACGGSPPVASVAPPRAPAEPLAPGSYDVIIEGGRIVDGTGNPWYAGDIGIRGERIAAITPPGL
ncbi:MAG: hypothetical protein FJ207_08070, partial [Gemmatimonadetes bacterium]|nr:hypothetical protein [Gemmatimonadota bacterium]